MGGDSIQVQTVRRKEEEGAVCSRSSLRGTVGYRFLLTELKCVFKGLCLQRHCLLLQEEGKLVFVSLVCLWCWAEPQASGPLGRARSLNCPLSPQAPGVMILTPFWGPREGRQDHLSGCADFTWESLASY